MKNFIIRLFTAIAIVAVQVLCTYLSPYSFAGLFLLLTALAVNEFLKVLSHGGVQVSRPLMIVGSCYLFFAFWLDSLTGFSMLVLFAPYLLFLLFCYIRELFSNNGDPISNLGAMVLSQAYVVLPLSLMNLLAFSHFDCFSASAPYLAQRYRCLSQWYAVGQASALSSHLSQEIMGRSHWRCVGYDG